MKRLAILTCLVVIGLVALRLLVSLPSAPLPVVRFPPASDADLAAQHELMESIKALYAAAEVVREEIRVRPDASYIERKSLSFDPGEMWRVESYGPPLFSWQIVDVRAAQQRYAEAVLRRAGELGVFARMARAAYMQSWPCSDPAPRSRGRGGDCDPNALQQDLGNLWSASTLACARLCQAAGDGDSASAAEALRIQLRLAALGRALPASSGGYLEPFPLDQERQQVIQWLASMRHPAREVWAELARVYDVDAPAELRESIGAERASIAVEMFLGDGSHLPVDFHELYPRYLPETFFDATTGRSAFQIASLDCTTDTLGRAYLVTPDPGHD